jgi:hypothetical protein
MLGRMKSSKMKRRVLKLADAVLALTASAETILAFQRAQIPTGGEIPDANYPAVNVGDSQGVIDDLSFCLYHAFVDLFNGA